MRQVKVFKNENIGGRKTLRVFDTFAVFHQWGQEADGEGQSNPVAIVELATGEVRTVYAPMIEFYKEGEPA